MTIERLALLATPEHDFLLMHFDCALLAARSKHGWVAGELTNTAPRLEDDICTWCGLTFEERPLRDELELVRLPSGDHAWLRTEKVS